MSYNKVERSMAILNVFFNFIQVMMPKSNMVVITDPASALPVRRNGVSLFPIQGEHINCYFECLEICLFRCCVQIELSSSSLSMWLIVRDVNSLLFMQAFLQSRLEDHSQWQGKYNHYIFTDSDVAVVGDDLGQVFNNYQHFHVALTFRNNKDQPLNSGFTAVRGTSKVVGKVISVVHGGMSCVDGWFDAIALAIALTTILTLTEDYDEIGCRAKVLLQEVLKIYSSKYMKASRMLGDQLALAWVVKSHPSFDTKRFTRRQPFVEEIGGASVLFLPCSVYNWTPPEGAGRFHGMPLDVEVVHVKGSRKRLMLESWNFLNSSSSSDISDMLCLILKSGRTTYDF
ncbi:hypothetical protein RJ640_002291 [Escallonia rubra]|uniref:Uncharacterized protein n=1 Tax=Escallonia rubra TaxID=112253 RepID=A0AA88RKY0_9ASTE|nr:hypothetical protein RJ640_002291 [Escallonia rubra]